MYTNARNTPARRALARRAAAWSKGGHKTVAALAYLVTALLLVTLLPARAAAWGWQGHHLVIRLAEKRLNSTARQRIKDILKDEHQANDCGSDHSTLGMMLCGGMWPDDSRKTTHKNTYNWHFVDISLGDRDYEESRDCVRTGWQSQGKCGLIGLDRALRIAKGELNDPNITRPQALMFILHIVGDLQQPLHSVLDGGGGNSHKVVYFDVFTDMHKVWDTKLIESHMINEGLGVPGYADVLAQQIATAGASSFAESNRKQWVLESHAAAIDIAYGKRPAQKTATHNGRKYHSLRGTYLGHGLKAVELQLKRGGVRLADILNEAFG
jgi:nuclease S1